VRHDPIPASTIRHDRPSRTPIGLSRHAALRALLRIALPDLEVPRVLGIDDFALRRGLVYATILIDAETGRRVDVLEGRTVGVVEDWLRAHPGVEVVTRDGSGAYGEAVRAALPAAVQVSDRWEPAPSSWSEPTLTPLPSQQ
jgi:transposase